MGISQFSEGPTVCEVTEMANGSGKMPRNVYLESCLEKADVIDEALTRDSLSGKGLIYTTKPFGKSEHNRSLGSGQS